MVSEIKKERPEAPRMQGHLFTSKHIMGNMVKSVMLNICRPTMCEFPKPGLVAVALGHKCQRDPKLNRAWPAPPMLQALCSEQAPAANNKVKATNNNLKPCKNNNQKHWQAKTQPTTQKKA